MYQCIWMRYRYLQVPWLNCATESHYFQCWEICVNEKLVMKCTINYLKFGPLCANFVKLGQASLTECIEIFNPFLMLITTSGILNVDIESDPESPCKSVHVSDPVNQTTIQWTLSLVPVRDEFCRAINWKFYLYMTSFTCIYPLLCIFIMTTDPVAVTPMVAAYASPLRCIWN